MEPGRQFEQLPMFMPARDLMDPAQVTPEQVVRDSGWGRKLTEAKQPMAFRITGRKTGPSLHDSIRQHGIVWPVELKSGPTGPPRINEGHHRIAVAHDIHPDYLVPVQHN